MKKYYSILISLLFCTLSISSMAQFQATMKYTLSGNEKHFKVFTDEDRYRYEFNEDGQQGVVIVLSKTGEVFVLMPQQKMAMKTISTSMMSMANDPLLAYNYQVNQGGIEKVIGHEKVNGIDCVKKELYTETEQLLYTIWFSEEYNFPIKMQSHMDITGNTNMELTDLKDWTPDDNSFLVPEGYTIMDQRTMMPEH